MKKLRPLKATTVEPPSASSIDDIKRTATVVAPPARLDEAPVAAAAAAMSEAVVAAVAESSKRSEMARTIVARYRSLAVAGGGMPLPLLDMAIVSGLQLKMLASLAKLYGVSFDRVRAKSLLSALAGGAATQGIAFGAVEGVGALMKLTPGIGTLIGIGTGMVAAGMVTDFVGKLFIRHFESGGTLMDFQAGREPAAEVAA